MELDLDRHEVTATCRDLISAGYTTEASELFKIAKQWSKNVKTKWHPEPGFFNQSGAAIASGLMKASKNKQQAMSRLNFYINRAGKNLSAAVKARLEAAKKKLHALE